MKWLHVIMDWSVLKCNSVFVKKEVKGIKNTFKCHK